MAERLDRIRKFLRRGDTDSICFICVVPVLIMMFAMLVNVTNLGETKEELQYATYAAGRAAVCSETLDDALANAETVAKENLRPYAQYIQGGIDKGVSVQLKAYNPSTKKTSSSSSKSWSKWEKGNYYRIRVRVKYNSMGSGFGNNTQTCEMVMAVEYDDA